VVVGGGIEIISGGDNFFLALIWNNRIKGRLED
jgi:hypothetical protein